MNDLQTALEELQASGLVIQGLTISQISVLLTAQRPDDQALSKMGSAINKLVAKDTASTQEQLTRLFQQGRMFGVHLYQDQAHFDRDEFARKLGQLGFDHDQAMTVIHNLRPVPSPELKNLGDRD